MIEASMARPKFRRRQRGVTLIEAALALGIVTVVIAGFAALLAQSSEATRAQSAGAQLKTVTAAAQSYAKANFTALQTQAAGGGFAVPLSTLTAGGFLPQNFVNTNPYGQGYTILVQPVPGPAAVDVLIATFGGTSIPDRLIAKAASVADAAGGYVSAQNPTTIQGAYGGWQDSTARWAFGGAPTSGRLAATLSFKNGQIAEFLYRDQVPGHPEANRMETALDLGGNNIENVLLLNAQSVNATGTVTAQTVAAQTFSANNADVTGALTAGSAAIGSDLTAARDVVAGRDLTSGRNVSAVGDGSFGQDVAAARNGSFGQDVTVGRDLAAAGNVTGGYLIASLDVTAGRNVNAAGSVSANGNGNFGVDVTAGRNVNASNGVNANGSGSFGVDVYAGRFGNAQDYYVRALGDYVSNLFGRYVPLSAVPICSGSNQALQFNGGFTCVAVSGGGGGITSCTDLDGSQIPVGAFSPYQAVPTGDTICQRQCIGNGTFNNVNCVIIGP